MMNNIIKFLFKSAAYSTAGILTTTYVIALAKALEESAEHAKRFPNAKPSSTATERFLKTYYPFLLPKPNSEQAKKISSDHSSPTIGPK